MLTCTTRHTVVQLVIFLAFVVTLTPFGVITSIGAEQNGANADIVRMLKAGLSEDLIILMVGDHRIHSDASPDALIALKNEGASDDVLRAVVASAEQPTSAQVTSAGATAARSLGDNSHHGPTDQQIDEAIQRAAAVTVEPHGVELVEVFNQLAQGLGALMAAQGQLTPTTQLPSSGFRITLFAPLNWITEQASEAVQRGDTFNRRNVTSDMLRPVLRVRAVASMAPAIGLTAGFGNSFVENVTLLDTARTRRLQPSRREAISVQSLPGTLFEFPLDALARIRSKDPEFFVLVSGSGSTKEFKVKRRHISALWL